MHASFWVRGRLRVSRRWGTSCSSTTREEKSASRFFLSISRISTPSKARWRYGGLVASWYALGGSRVRLSHRYCRHQCWTWHSQFGNGHKAGDRGQGHEHQLQRSCGLLQGVPKTPDPEHRHFHRLHQQVCACLDLSFLASRVCCPFPLAPLTVPRSTLCRATQMPFVRRSPTSAHTSWSCLLLMSSTLFPSCSSDRTNHSLSAITGDGTPYGKMDATTAKGMVKESGSWHRNGTWGTQSSHYHWCRQQADALDCGSPLDEVCHSHEVCCWVLLPWSRAFCPNCLDYLLSFKAKKSITPK